MNASMLKGRRMAVSWMTLALLSACGGGGGGGATAPLASAAGGGSTATGTPWEV